VGRLTVAERFDAKFVPEPNSGCWLWTASTKGSGYGSFGICAGRVELAHRASWEIHRGQIPKGMHVLHRCDTPACVNPEHLFLGTAADNMADKAAKGRARTPRVLSTRARGKTSGAHTKPHRRPRGGRNGSRTKPERLARGDSNGSRKYPERLVRGVQHHNARLVPSSVRMIRRLASEGLAYVEIAELFGVSDVTVRNVARRKTWRHVE